MAQPAYVRHAKTDPGAGFTRYPSVQIDHGTGNNRVLLAWVQTDSSDPSMDFASCYAGCTASGSQSGGTAMTACATAPVNSAGRQIGRLFYLAGASLPTGTSYVVGDATYTDRKPGIVAILLDDSGGGPITVSAGVNRESEATSHTWTVSGTTGANELMLAFGLGTGGATLTWTSPASASAADQTWIDVFQRSGAASSTAINATSSLDWIIGTAVVLTGAAPTDTTPPDITSTGTGSTNGPFAANLAENSTSAFITLTANENVTWGALGGADAALFSKSGATATTVQLVPVSAFNFESLPHANPFVVTVPATDGASNTTTVTLNVTITNVTELPGTPTIGTATAGNASASVAFTPPAAGSAPTVTSYTVTATPGGLTGTGASSPITVSSLTNGTAYTFKVKAQNSDGFGSESAASNSVTPSAGGGDTTPPTMSAASVTGGTLSATGSVTSNEAGTLWWKMDGSATATDPGAGNEAGAGWTSQSMLASANSVNFSTQPAGTRYGHFLGIDAAGNRAAVVNASGTVSGSGGGLATSVSITLTTDGTTPAANLTGLKVAVYDQATPDLWAGHAPIYATASGTTNGSGVLTCNITGLTSLAPGALAGLVVSNSDGTLTQGAAQKGYVGPALVS